MKRFNKGHVGAPLGVDCMFYIDRVAVAGITIADNRNIYCIRNVLGLVYHLAHKYLLGFWKP